MDDQKEKIAEIVNGKQSLKYGIYHHYSTFTQENGITDGALEIDDPSFQEYLSFNHQRVLIENKIYLNEREIRETKAKIQEVNQNTALYIERKHQIAQADNEIKLREKGIENAKSKHSILGEKRKSLIAKYGLLASTLFLFVGFLFIAADLFLTKDILENALNFEIGSGETYLLAAAIAGLAFAVKPFVDHILNGENKNNAKHKRSLLLLTSILVLLALLSLGYYRTWFLSNQNRIDRESQIIEEEILNFQVNEDKVLILEGKMFRHWAIVTSVTLLSFLFALVGAICFSISFPDLRICWNKAWVYLKIFKCRIEIKIKEKQLRKAQSDRTKKLSEMEFAFEKIKLMDKKIESYHDKLRELNEREEKLLEQYAVAIEEADKAWYKISKSRGIFYHHRDDFVIPGRNGVDIHDIIIKTIYEKSGMRPMTKLDERLGVEGGKNRNTPHLHKYLRKSVSEKYSKINGKVKLSPNGKKG